MSDHGYSTIAEVVDVESLLKSSGLKGSEEWLVAENGGSVLFYLKDIKNVSLATELIEWLSSQVWCGTLCSSERLEGVPGTIPLSSINVVTKQGTVPVSSFVKVIPKENRQTVNRKNGKYFQEITVSCVGDTKYVDQGNAW